MQEEWRPIDGYPNYQVSNRGRVMSLKSGRLLKPRVDSKGYSRVSLGRGNLYSIHRLVANAFLENPDNLPYVNHVDECKTNNDVSNLAWCTASQNIKHSTHKRSCQINQLTLDGQFIKKWESLQEIGRELGYAPINICRVCKGKFKKAYGYKWEYADGLHQRSQNRPVIALTIEDKFVAEYKSTAEASRCLGITYQSIMLTLKGKHNTTHGLKFKYADEQ